MRTGADGAGSGDCGDVAGTRNCDSGKRRGRNRDAEVGANERDVGARGWAVAVLAAVDILGLLCYNGGVEGK